MIITHLNGEFAENCYIYVNKSTNEALVVDPGYEMETLFTMLKPYQLTHIFITHGHIDHIAGLKELKERYPSALICGHETTKETLPNPEKNFSYRWGDLIYAPAPDWTYSGKEGLIEACGQKWRCLYTLGHAYDHTAFLGENDILFGGDVIFEGGSFGRYDLPTSNFEDLKESLVLILALPETVHIYPGHGGDFTVKEALPYFKGLSI